MKHKLTLTLYLFLCSLLIMSVGCKNQVDGKCFKTKQDSIDFVNAVLEKYPESQPPIKAAFKGDAARTSLDGTRKMTEGIDFERMREIYLNYDGSPLIQNKKGFFIDTQAWEIIRSDPNYKKIYLAFGKHSNDPRVRDDYTVMIIPLKEDNTLVHRGRGILAMGQPSNYDYLDPCPYQCPEGFP